MKTGTVLQQTQQLLKRSGSVRCTLVLGDDLYADKKGFSWELTSYDSDKLGIKFVFEHPEYISSGSTDSMKV